MLLASSWPFTGNCTIEDLYILNFDNWMYDQQNMGIDNFINSTFLYALGRSPTRSEFLRSFAMINGNSTNLLFQWGNSKEDYYSILTCNENFIERQIQFWYYYFLFRYPDVKEIYGILNELYATGEVVDLAAVIQYIIVHKLDS